MEDVYWTIPLICLLVFLSGFFSGLTLGFIGLQKSQLTVLSQAVTEDEETLKMAKYAKAILPVRERGNLLLCTLVIANVSVNSGLSILLADFTDGLLGFILSTILIVILGEIIPQATCSRYGLLIGSKVVPLIKFLMVVQYPVAKPISLILDKIMGEDVGTLLNRHQMKAMFSVYQRQAMLNPNQHKILTATLDIHEREVNSLMTPIEKVYMVDANREFGLDLMKEIYETGFSRMPIYQESKTNIIGILLAKDLMFLNQQKANHLWNLKSLFLRPPMFLKTSHSVDHALHKFKQGSHIAIIREQKYDAVWGITKEVVGILTMEDIIEALLQDEIVDQRDMHRKNSVNYLPSSNTYNTSEIHPFTRQKTAMIFSDDLVISVLTDRDISEIAYYLRENLLPFTKDKISKENLKKLLRESHLLFFTGDEDSDYSDSEEETERAKDKISNTILKQGHKFDCFFLILSGSVRRIGGDQIVVKQGPFKYLGLKALNPPFSPCVAEATARIEKPTKLLRIHQDLYASYSKINRV